MTTATNKQMDNLELIQRRMEILSGAKLRERDRINSAIKIQDLIRAKSGRWNGSKEIRKWREAR